MCLVVCIYDDNPFFHMSAFYVFIGQREGTRDVTFAGMLISLTCYFVEY